MSIDFIDECCAHFNTLIGNSDWKQHNHNQWFWDKIEGVCWFVPPEKYNGLSPWIMLCNVKPRSTPNYKHVNFLLFACLSGRWDLVFLMLHPEAEVDAYMKKGSFSRRTVLMHLILKEQYKLARRVIEECKPNLHFEGRQFKWYNVKYRFTPFNIIAIRGLWQVIPQTDNELDAPHMRQKPLIKFEPTDNDVLFYVDYCVIFREFNIKYLSVETIVSRIFNSRIKCSALWECFFNNLSHQDFDMFKEVAERVPGRMSKIVTDRVWTDHYNGDYWEYLLFPLIWNTLAFLDIKLDLPLAMRQKETRVVTYVDNLIYALNRAPVYLPFEIKLDTIRNTSDYVMGETAPRALEERIVKDYLVIEEETKKRDIKSKRVVVIMTINNLLQSDSKVLIDIHSLRRIMYEELDLIEPDFIPYSVRREYIARLSSLPVVNRETIKAELCK